MRYNEEQTLFQTLIACKQDPHAMLSWNLFGIFNKLLKLSCNLHLHTIIFINFKLAYLLHDILVSSSNCPKFTKIGDFSKHFLLRYLMVKTQSSFKFQNSILHPLYFNDSYFITVLFLIHYSLQKHFKSFLVFFLLEAYFLVIYRVSNRKVFTAFHKPPWGHFECH